MNKSRNKIEFIPAFLVASLPSIFVITALSLARSNVGKYNHHGLELNSETKQIKEQRKYFWVFQGLTKAKERINLSGFLQIKRTKKNRQKLQKDESKQNR